MFDNATVAVGIHSGWVVMLSENKLSRTGGMPPLVMVFAAAEATFTDNVLVGGGVAGVRVAGTVHLVNNELVGTSLRKGGPPNFAVWGLPGSDITMTGNTARHWRHALQATESTVQASKNNVEEFFGAAFVIRKAPNFVSVFGNTAVSANPDDKVVLLTESKGTLRDNVVIAPDTTKAGKHGDRGQSAGQSCSSHQPANSSKSIVPLASESIMSNPIRRVCSSMPDFNVSRSSQNSPKSMEPL